MKFDLSKVFVRVRKSRARAGAHCERSEEDMGHLAMMGGLARQSKAVYTARPLTDFGWRRAATNRSHTCQERHKHLAPMSRLEPRTILTGACHPTHTAQLSTG